MQFPVALIPAYRPDPAFPLLVRRLAQDFAHIVVVDDGSGAAYAQIMADIAALPQVTVLHHHVNMGKGAALWTGLNHAAVAFPEAVGVVTLDADGQHLPEDVIRVARRLSEEPEALVLGCRTFAPKVPPAGKNAEKIPWRSRFGNEFTSNIFYFFTGMRVSDTQTGLRGIPRNFIAHVLRLRTRGYDFELDMLLLAHNRKFPLVEVPIATVYLDNNASSHFNPLLDSLKIYMVFLRFSVSSILTAIIDYVVFTVCMMLGGNLALGIAGARVVAGGFNFAVNRAIVFKDRSSHWWSLGKYVGCVLLMGTLSYYLIQILTLTVCSSVFVAKLISEGLLYLVSFILQRDFIFGNGLEDSSLTGKDSA